MNTSISGIDTDPTADAQAILGGLAYVEQSIEQSHAFAVVTSNEPSTRNVLVRRFIRNGSSGCVWAHLKEPARSQHEFLERMLEGFGFDPFESTIEDLRSILRVFLTHQHAERRKVVVIVENAHRSSAHALKEMQRIGKIRISEQVPVTLILTGSHDLNRVLDSPAMLDVSDMTSRRFSLDRATRETADEYFHRVLNQPDDESRALPGEKASVHVVSTRLTNATDEFARLDEDAVDIIDAALRALESHLPDASTTAEIAVGVEDADSVPGMGKLILSLNGDVVSQFLLEKEHVVIGRNQHNDVTIPSRYVSRHHALIVNRPAGAYLVDLKSTNGISVNSMPVEYYALQHNDVISIGNHRLKYVNAASRTRMTLPGSETPEFSETLIMRSAAGIADSGSQVVAECHENLDETMIARHRIIPGS